MESLRIVPNLEEQGFQEGDYAVVEHKTDVVIGGMPNGTVEGNPVVMIGLEHPDPEVDGYLVTQTTLALFLTAADALKAMYGDPRTRR